jgi:hypothetical protein
MRFALLVLFFSIGAFCQAAQLPTDSDRHNGSSATGKPSTAPIDLDKLFSSSPVMKPFTPLELFAPAQVAVKAPTHGTEVDPKIIVRPPKASLGLQQGIPINQGQFANLQMLPIDSPSAAINPIPAQWPNLKIQAIPTQWPRLEVHPVE